MSMQDNAMACVKSKCSVCRGVLGVLGVLGILGVTKHPWSNTPNTHRHAGKRRCSSSPHTSPSSPCRPPYFLGLRLLMETRLHLAQDAGFAGGGS
jgi:hypothetical protein